MEFIAVVTCQGSGHVLTLIFDTQATESLYHEQIVSCVNRRKDEITCEELPSVQNGLTKVNYEKCEID
jgi:hypothetical protein